jgi:hypothetical protein
LGIAGAPTRGLHAPVTQSASRGVMKRLLTSPCNFVLNSFFYLLVKTTIASYNDT